MPTKTTYLTFYKNTMGLFDYFRSSYYLGPGLTEVSCQTKDLGSTMSEYWLDPSGRLWLIDIGAAFDYGEYPDFESKGEPFEEIFRYGPIPNGKHGKVTPERFTGMVLIYPSQGIEDWGDQPCCELKFTAGVLQYYDITTNAERISEYQRKI